MLSRPKSSFPSRFSRVCAIGISSYITLGIAIPASSLMAQKKQTIQASKISNAATASKDFKFDVISIRPLQSDTPSSGTVNYNPTPDGFTSRLTLWQMLMIAYASGGYESWVSTPIINAPKIMSGSDWYIVDARVAAEDREAWRHQSNKNELLHSAMQALLRDRCKLVVHEQPSQIRDYKLVVSKNGPRLKPTAPGAQLPRAANLPSGGAMNAERVGGLTRWHYYGATIDDLVSFLSMASQQRPVHNLTGLAGHYDFTIQQADPASRNRDEPVYDWQIDQLGLELKSSSNSGYALVIDHMERPTPN